MRYGLIGQTLKHSRSPRLHALLGDPDYALFPMEPDELPAFLSKGDFSGLNVTIPYKRDVIPFCAELSETARRIGSVNTLVRRADGRLFGDNTDAYGFAKMAESAGIRFDRKKVLVLGSGGTSHTALDVIREAGGQPIVVSRHGENNYENLVKHADAAVLVNTTPVGMYPEVGNAPVDLQLFPRLEGVLDVVYNPLRTRLLQQAQTLGIPCAGGLWMLVWQAARARELFDGRSIPPETVNAAERTLRREASNLVLVGMPGSGKTTVGMRCAERLKLPFTDADVVIAGRAGKPIPRIFAENGEAAFRALEAEVIAEYGCRGGQVISTGGGAVLRAENRMNLRMNSVVIGLTRPIERLSTAGRPLSGDTSALQRMWEERAPLYRMTSDRTVDNAGTLEECVRAVLEAYHEALGD